MSGTSEAVSKAIDLTLRVVIGDKLSAEGVREIRRTLEDVHAGDITEQDAIDQLHFKHGDALDQALGRGGGDSPAS